MAEVGTGEAQWSEEVIEHPATNIDVADVKLFGKWSLNDVEVNDISLQVTTALDVQHPTQLEFANSITHSGLHCSEGQVCQVPSPQCWPLPDQAIP
jgi:hypothetical protein